MGPERRVFLALCTDLGTKPNIEKESGASNESRYGITAVRWCMEILEVGEGPKRRVDADRTKCRGRQSAWDMRCDSVAIAAAAARQKARGAERVQMASRAGELLGVSRRTS